MTETAECRHCRQALTGKPYRLGGQAYHPRTGERCPSNYYGGFVCSWQCDFNASLDLEQSMPGHGTTQKTIGTYARRRLEANWGEVRS